MLKNPYLSTVIPAPVCTRVNSGGNPFLWEKWIPAYAGMTIKSVVVIKK